MWADTANQYGHLAGSPLNSFARQTGGPSLLAGKKVSPRPELTQRGIGNDAAGDARRFGEGTSNPAMDLRDVKIADKGDSLVITARVSKGDLAGMLNPANGPAASIVVSWWAGKRNASPDNSDLGTIRFVGMQTSGAAPVFFGGSPTYTNSSSGTTRFAEFVPGPQAGPVSGSFDGNVVTWTISKAAAGLGGEFAPKSLFSVTGTTLQGAPTYTPNSAAEQVDATPPFTWTAR
jgi:hypothetical protein